MSVIIRESTPQEINKMKKNKQISFTETALFDGMERETGEIIIRQVHIGRFIVDGLLKGKTLIFEFDGHHHQERTERDLERDRFLMSLGFIIIRYQWFDFIHNSNEYKTALNCLIQMAVKDMSVMKNWAKNFSLDNFHQKH